MDFTYFSTAVQASFDHALKEGGGKLYHTGASPDLVEIYLRSFWASDERQYHNCSCCKHFLSHFGDLAYFDKTGRQRSVMWAPDITMGIRSDYQRAVVDLANAVENSCVVGTFHSSKPILGVPEAGGFHHFAVQVPKANRYSRRDMTAGQFMALQRERRAMLSAGLSVYHKQHLPAALALLKSGQLNRSAAYVAQAEKLVDLCNFDNDKLWRAVATEGDGFCHRGLHAGALAPVPRLSASWPREGSGGRGRGR